MKTKIALRLFLITISLLIASSLTALAQAKPKKIKIALLLDTSGSMDGLIDQAKAQLWSLVNELATAKCEGVKPDVTIALYEYGNDNLTAREGYIRLVTPLTSDLDKLSEDLFKLTTNGGSEFCGHVIQTATRQLDWSTDGMDLQVIFIAGNEPFNQGDVDWKKACANAKAKNIIVNTIYCGSYDEGLRSFWKNGADMAAGSYMSIDHDRKTVFVPSPYDDKISKLNEELNKTYIEYGTKGKEKKEAQLKQDANAAGYGSANTVKRAVSKSSHIYKNTTWDMVDAAEEASFDIKAIPQAQLPEPMKALNDTQKIAYVNTKKKEREKIKTEIQQLNIQREKYVSEQTKKNAQQENTLDKTMINTIKKQAATKNFQF